MSVRDYVGRLFGNSGEKKVGEHEQVTSPVQNDSSTIGIDAKLNAEPQKSLVYISVHGTGKDRDAAKKNYDALGDRLKKRGYDIPASGKTSLSNSFSGHYELCADKGDLRRIMNLCKEHRANALVQKEKAGQLVTVEISAPDSNSNAVDALYFIKQEMTEENGSQFTRIPNSKVVLKADISPANLKEIKGKAGEYALKIQEAKD